MTRAYRLVIRAVLEHALDHAAAVGMGGEPNDLALEGIDDELYALGGDPLDGLLDDVVAVLVFDALDNRAPQLEDKLGLLVHKHVFDGLEVRRAGGQGTFCTTRQPYICSDKDRT